MNETELPPTFLSGGQKSPTADGMDPLPSQEDPSPAGEPSSAVEAVRYLFLSRELRRLGQVEAADRWQAKAVAWLGRVSPTGESKGEAFSL